MQSVPESPGAKQNGSPGPAGPPERPRGTGLAGLVQLRSRSSCLCHDLGNSWPRDLREEAQFPIRPAEPSGRNSGQILGGGLPRGTASDIRQGVRLTRQGSVSTVFCFPASLLFTIFIGVFFHREPIRIRTASCFICEVMWL